MMLMALSPVEMAADETVYDVVDARQHQHEDLHRNHAHEQPGQKHSVRAKRWSAHRRPLLSIMNQSLIITETRIKIIFFLCTVVTICGFQAEVATMDEDCITLYTSVILSSGSLSADCSASGLVFYSTGT
jgi:hypothetical protein